jgi:hypothetical protein
MAHARRSLRPWTSTAWAAALRLAAGVTTFCQQILQRGVVEHHVRVEALELRVLLLERLQPLGLGDLQAAELGLPGVEGRCDIPCLRQTSATLAPASCSRSTPMICSSLNLPRFMSDPFG